MNFHTSPSSEVRLANHTKFHTYKLFYLDVKTDAAYKLAIKYLKLARKRLAFDANLFKQNIARNGYTERQAKEYDKITQAIETIEGVISGNVVE